MISRVVHLKMFVPQRAKKDNCMSKYQFAHVLTLFCEHKYLSKYLSRHLYFGDRIQFLVCKIFC